MLHSLPLLTHSSHSLFLQHFLGRSLKAFFLLFSNLGTWSYAGDFFFFWDSNLSFPRMSRRSSCLAASPEAPLSLRFVDTVVSPPGWSITFALVLLSCLGGPVFSRLPWVLGSLPGHIPRPHLTSSVCLFATFIPTCVFRWTFCRCWFRGLDWFLLCHTHHCPPLFPANRNPEAYFTPSSP